MEAARNNAATVFLSYSREDQKRALPVIKALESAGCEVWWDGLLEGGDNFLPTTEKALEEADAVVVLWSKTSVASHWVRDEATRGRERGCLVPLSIDGTHPPLGFRQFQTIDISKWRGKANAPEFARAVRAVTALAGQAQTAPVPPPRQPLLSRRAMIAGGGVLVAGAAGIATWKLGLGTAHASGNSVAVLPFNNLSGDAAQDYFAKGVSEQIRSTLSRNARLLVLAPASITAVAKDLVTDERAIAQKLGVAFLLTGTVRRSGEVVRIDARLVNGATGGPAWSDQFERKLIDVFALQDEVADRVAGAIAAQTVTGDRHAVKGPGGTRNPDAYDAYLRGNAFYDLRSGESSYRAALAQYDAAIAADPSYAEAHAARARVIVVITSSYAQADQFKAAYADALASARKAAELAPDLATVQSTLGYVLVQGMLDFKGAAAPYEAARKNGQGDADVLRFYGTYAAEMGRAAEADQAISRSIQLDPLNPGALRMAAFVAYCAGNWQAAVERARRAIALKPQIDQAHAYIGDALIQQGRIADARKEYEQESQSLLKHTGLAIAALRLGDQATAKAETDKLLAEFGDGATYQTAQILAQSGQADQAMAKLHHAREIGDVGLALSFTDPMLKPLRGRPDFSRLLAELGFG